MTYSHKVAQILMQKHFIYEVIPLHKQMPALR